MWKSSTATSCPREWKTILFAPTGALLSPTSSGQGESIPSICHAVRLSAVRE